MLGIKLQEKKMKWNFRLIGKIGLLLVVFGFFMPIACDRNGFQIAEFMMKNDRTLEGLLLYVLVISAAIGVVIGIFLLMRRAVNSSIDWAVIIACIASGLIVYFGSTKNKPELQSGAYLILAGWITALAAQIISKISRES
jgi:nitrate reductase gamma subunit